MTLREGALLQGDILSGTIATMLAWTATLESRGGSVPQLGIPSTVVASWGACLVVRTAACLAFQKKGRSMLAGDVIENLGSAIHSHFEEPPS